ncbi:TetR family transcriptional regulator [Aeromicrobium sp.]|uniref:TetR/AcrR family transcriptional regulator n=1 Tax=Aeromicrobium sp. TaxID=1871063 RepID=UPI0030C08E96
MPDSPTAVANPPKTPASRVRPTRRETRQSVLDAALEVFGEHGIAASSLTDVAAAAGLTKGAVYSSFASKDDLVLALMEDHAMQRITASLAGVAAAVDPHEIVNNVAAVLVREMRTDAAWHRLLAEYFAMAHRDPRLKEALRERRAEARAAVVRALDTLTEVHGIEFPLPIEEMAVLLFALSNGLAVESGIDPDAVPDDLLGKVLTLLAPEAITLLNQAGQDPTGGAA